MSEQEFYQQCEGFLSNLAEEIEQRDKVAALEVEYADGILEIVLVDGKTYVINRNAGNQKIWYSSPFSGADYFVFEAGQWCNDSGLELSQKLFSELSL